MTTSEHTAAALADAVCRVCGLPVDADAAACPACGQAFNGGLVLGHPTPRMVSAFERELADARRNFDLIAAARAAGAPWHTDTARLTRLEALVRDGPPAPGERDAVLGQLAREKARLTVRPDATPLDVAGTDPGHGPGSAVIVAEIGITGVTRVEFARAASGSLREIGDEQAWTWRELAPALPTQPDPALFVLAGGVGTLRSERRPDAVVPDLRVAAEAQVVVVNRLPGWPVPDALVTALLRAHPHARTVLSPATTDAPRTTRVPGGCTAAAVADGGDGVHVAAGRADGSAAVMRLGQAAPLAEKAALHQGRVTAVAIAADAAYVVTGGNDGVVRLWLFTGSGRDQVLTRHPAGVEAVRIRDDAVFSIDADGGLHRSPAFAGSGPPRYAVSVPFSAALEFALSRDARLLVVGGPEGATVLDATTGTPRATLRTPRRVTALALDPDDRFVALGREDGVIHVLPVAGNPVVREGRPADDDAAADREAWDAHDNWDYWDGWGTWDGRPRRDRGETLVRATGDRGRVRRLAFGPGGVLAVAHDSGEIVRVRWADDAAMPLGPAGNAVRALEFTPTGDLLTVADDGAVRVWRRPEPD